MYNSEPMSYYTLPTINNNIIVNPIASDMQNTEPYISHSLYRYFNELYNYAYNIKMDDDPSYNSYETVSELVNVYEYIFSKSGSKFSVSKLKVNSNLFYDLIEVASTLNIFDKINTQMNTLHISKNYSDSVECLKLLRATHSDEITYIETIEDNDISKNINSEKYDFLFFETDNTSIQKYIITFIEAIMTILKYQNNNGFSIIKINYTFHRPIIELLYFLSSVYEKVYIIKPSASNIINFDKYIVCTNFILNETNINQYKLNYYKLFVFLKKNENKNIISILDIEIPYYFTTKLVEINNIIGQPQLESLDQIITILRSKNKEDKIEVLKKTNIQKSIKWCEKYKIPYNKISEKTNIFLPVFKEDESNSNLIGLLDDKLLDDKLLDDKLLDDKLLDDKLLDDMT
jgi:hypothetical protein